MVFVAISISISLSLSSPASMLGPHFSLPSHTPPKRISRIKSSFKSNVISQLELNPPPYPLNALEPYMSRQTLEHHWGRHHRAHVETLNAIIENTDLDSMQLEDIILASYNKVDRLPAFNHAAQIWNNEFFWQSMRVGGGGLHSGILLSLIERDFGSFDRLLKELKRAAMNQFGSGWVWLAYKANKLDVDNAVNPCPSEKDNKLVVTKTPNAVNPLVWDYSPILAIDLWEHAYYLDYENRRADYVSNFLEKLVSWEVVSSRLDKAIEKAEARMKEDERRQKDEEEMNNTEPVEMYLDSDNDD